METDRKRRDTKTFRVDGQVIRSLGHESYKMHHLEAAMFSDFPESLDEFLSWNTRNLVKTYDQSPENMDEKYKMSVPVRFYLSRGFGGVLYKNLEMPKGSTNILMLSDDSVSHYINWKISPVVGDKIKEINKITKSIYKRQKEEYKRRLAEIKR
jgi:hypothetical protein